MNSRSYPRNAELQLVLRHMQNIKGICGQLFYMDYELKKRKHSKNAIHDFNDKLLHVQKEIYDLASSFRDVADDGLKHQVTRQLKLCKKRFKWNNKYLEIIRMYRAIVRLVEQYIDSNYSKEKRNELLKRVPKTNKETDKFYKDIYECILQGRVDNCVLPQKNQIHYPLPISGTVLGIDLVHSRLIKEDKVYNIMDEARRIAFEKEGWEWTDEGDGLHLYFFDQKKNPDISHSTRALETAVEIVLELHINIL